jgi:hypothetical protein
MIKTKMRDSTEHVAYIGNQELQAYIISVQVPQGRRLLAIYIFRLEDNS